MRNKQFIKKTFLFIIIAIVILGGSVSATRQNQNPIFDGSVEELKYADQTHAIKIWYEIERHVKEGEGKEKHYHPDYGGAYVTLDGGLVVLIMPEGEKLQTEIEQIVDNAVPVQFTTCSWSREEAQRAVNELVELIGDQAECICFEVMRGAVVVDCFAECAEELREIVNKLMWNTDPSRPPLIVINELEVDSLGSLTAYGQYTLPANVESSPYIYCGDPIYREDTSLPSNYNVFYANASVGICGSYGGDPCILTAAHVSGIYNPIYVNYIATTYSSLLSPTNIFVHGTGGDYTALYIPNGYYRTNAVYTSNLGDTGTITKYSTDESFPVGTVVHKYGISTGYTAGLVVGENGSTNQIKINPISQNTTIALPGDSGAPFWYFDPNSGQRVTLGVLSGVTGISTTYVLFTPVIFPVYDGFIPYNMISISLEDLV